MHHSLSKYTFGRYFDSVTSSAKLRTSGNYTIWTNQEWHFVQDITMYNDSRLQKANIIGFANTTLITYTACR